MLWQHCNWLLKFKRPGLEELFWQYPPVRLHLLSIDQLAAAMVVANNAVIVFKMASMLGMSAVAQPAAPGAMLNDVCWVAAFVAPVLAANVLQRARPEAYSRHRSAILFAHRAVRVAALYVQQARLLAADVPDSVLQGAGASAAAARALVFKNLALRPTVFLWMHCFLFPVAFRYQSAFQLASLPVALALARVNAAILAQPQLRAASCEAFRYVRFTTLYFSELGMVQGLHSLGGHDADCPSFAPQYVAYFFALIPGIVLPLMLVYGIEARQRCWFLSATSGARDPYSTERLGLKLAVAVFVAVHLAHLYISLHVVFQP